MSDLPVGAGQEPQQTAKKDALTISDAAQHCLDGFQSCLDMAALIHSREVSLVEDQLARFSIWAANIKALGRGRDSLDHRLREAPDVQDIITGLLEALGAHLHHCWKSLDAASNRESPEGKEKLLAPVDSDLNRGIQHISNSISLLHKFSNTIRKASKATQDTKAASSFEILDEDGNNVEPFLKDMFARYVLDKFPEADEQIRQRLVATMITRRKRILYRRSRYGTTGKQPQKQEPVQRQVQRPAPKFEPAPVIQPEEAPTSQTAQAPAPAEPPQDEQRQERSAAPTATTLRPERFQKASTPSVISVSQSVALSGHEELSFPPPPCGTLFRRYNKMKRTLEARQRSLGEMVVDGSDSSAEESGSYHDTYDHTRPSNRVSRLARSRRLEREKELSRFWKKSVEKVGEVTCPYCFHAIPAKDAVDDRKWRNHVKNDLDPYVCLFEGCESAEELHTHSNPWLKHMREHTLKWKCVSKSHDPFTTQVRSQYLEHMRLVHGGKFSEAQLDVLADRNGARMTGPMFPSCPLCGIRKEELEQVNMENHVVGHLRHLALKSLPAYEENVDDDDDSDQSSVATSRPDTRSTIRNYTEDRYLTRPHLHSELNAFEEIYTDEWLPKVIAEDAGSVEQTSYDGIAPEERRYYEWPFLAEREADPVNPRQDPTLATFVMRWFQQSRGEESGPHIPRELTPNCAICYRPDAEVCKCEDRAFQIAVKQAEHRVLWPLRQDLVSWVRRKAQDHVFSDYRLYWDNRALQEASGSEAGPAAENSPFDLLATEGGEDAKAPEKYPEEDMIERDLSGLKVLIAKADSIGREVISRMLKLESIENVTVAEDGQNALDLVKGSMDLHDPFDLIFVSVSLPKLDGLETTARIRGLGYTARIVAVAPFFGDDQIKECHTAGMDDYLSEPVRRPALRQILSKHAHLPHAALPRKKLPGTLEEHSETWRTACISFPETIDYFFSLTEFTLPPNDDRSVIDPPLRFRNNPLTRFGDSGRVPVGRKTKRDAHYDDDSDSFYSNFSYSSASVTGDNLGTFPGSQALGKSSGSQDPDGESTTDQAESASGVKQVRFHQNAELLEIERDDGDDKADDYGRVSDAEGDAAAAENVRVDVPYFPNHEAHVRHVMGLFDERRRAAAAGRVPASDPEDEPVDHEQPGGSEVQHQVEDGRGPR